MLGMGLLEGNLRAGCGAAYALTFGCRFVGHGFVIVRTESFVQYNVMKSRAFEP